MYFYTLCTAIFPILQKHLIGMCAFFVIRNVLEINSGGDRSPSPDDKIQSTDPSCSAADKTNDCASVNGCGAELSNGTEEKNDQEEKETASVDSCEDHPEYAAETDRLAGCRMTLLEDMASPSSDDSTACPRFSVVHSNDRPPIASTLALIIDAESSTSTTDPDTASKDVTATEMETLLSKGDNFPATIIAYSWPDTKSKSTDTFGSKLYGDADKDFKDESLIYFEPDVASPLLSSGAVAESKSSTVQYSIWNNDRHTSRADDSLSGSAYKDLEVEITTSDMTMPSKLSIDSYAASRDAEGHLLNVEKSVCNGNQMQHPDETTDSTYGGTTHKDLEVETAICSEAKTSISVTPSTISSAVSCGHNVQSQSSTVKDAVCCNDRHSEATTDRMKDRSGCRNISNTNTPWPTDGSLKVETKSASTCGTPLGSAPWSLSSYSGCGSRMKGLRIPSSTTSSAGKSNGSLTMTTSQDVRPCLDMPLIAGITARRIGDSSTPGVLPATLLPRPFISRSRYRSVRPFCSTTPAVRATDNNADSGNLTERAGNGLSPPIVSVRESTTATAVVTSHPTLSFNHKFTIGEVKPVCTASSVVQEPEDQIHNRIMAAKALTPLTNGVVESTTVGATEKVVHPACPPTTNCRQQLMSNEVYVSNNFQGIHVSTNMSTSGEPSSSINGCESVLENHSITSSHQNSKSTEVTDSEDAFASPNLIMSGQPVLIDDSQQPAYKLLRPPTMPKPALPCPAPPAVRVADPLPPSPSSLRHSVTQDDDRTISSADPAGRRRTTPDGGSDSVDQRETTTSTTSSDATSTTATAGSNTTTTSFHLERYSLPGNQSTVTLHKEQVIEHPIIIEKEGRPAITSRRRESDRMEEAAVEKMGLNGTVLGTINNGCNNSVDHSNAAQLEMSSVSAKLSVEEQRKPRDPREASASSDGRLELTRRTTAECIEDAAKYVEASSHQLKTEIISLEKGVFGLGFCIEGGRDCPTGRAPVTVKRIFRGELNSMFSFIHELEYLTCSLG